MCDATAITNLLHRYAEYMDGGQFGEAARLFRHGRVRMTPDDDAWMDSGAVQKFFEDNVVLHSDGTPRTSHVTTNAIVEFDGLDVAEARSRYTVCSRSAQDRSSASQPAATATVSSGSRVSGGGMSASTARSSWSGT